MLISTLGLFAVDQNGFSDAQQFFRLRARKKWQKDSRGPRGRRTGDETEAAGTRIYWMGASALAAWLRSIISRHCFAFAFFGSKRSVSRKCSAASETRAS